MAKNNLITPTRQLTAKQRRTLLACSNLLRTAVDSKDKKVAFGIFMAAARQIESMTPEYFSSWDEAREEIPAGDIWTPKIELREQGDGWFWKDILDGLSKWAGPFGDREDAAKAACMDNNFHPIITGKEVS